MINLLNRHKKDEIHSPSDVIREVSQLVKTYDDFTAVDGISFSVKRGSLFAFLGLNGAGKSTTINIITSIIPKNSGKIYIDGLDLDKHRDAIKNKIGIVFQNSVLDPVLTPKENLTLRAGFYGITGDKFKKRLQVLTDRLDLSSFRNRPVGKLSGGQRRRVDIARAMVHDPELLILDEPTTGLDPQTRLSVWNLVNTLRQQTGMTVFLTTHYREEAEKATYVLIRNHGHIIAEGTPAFLRDTYSGDYVRIHHKNTDDFETIIKGMERPYSYNHDAHTYQVKVKDSKDAIALLEKYKDILDDFEVKKGSRDDVFLNVTGFKQIREADHHEAE